MASKRGLSTEEKRKRMLDFFFEKQDFFQLKDIEKLCSQEKGITLNTIKDILMSLVDDGLVDSEKIGTSLYYWSLPSKALRIRQDKIVAIEQGLIDEKKRNEALKEELAKYESSSQDEDKRQSLEEECSTLLSEQQRIYKELEQYKENDPQQFEQMKLNNQICVSACNRWIDNIYTLRSWLKNKFRIQESVIDKQFEIPDDLDYLNN